MLKRLGFAVLVLLVLVAGVAGVVLAQDPTPPPADLCPFGETCGGYGMGGYGMRGYGYAGAMPTLLAEALGMTVEETTRTTRRRAACPSCRCWPSQTVQP